MAEPEPIFWGEQRVDAIDDRETRRLDNQPSDHRWPVVESSTPILFSADDGETTVIVDVFCCGDDEIAESRSVSHRIE
jgi:hypothetical protein